MSDTLLIMSSVLFQSVAAEEVMFHWNTWQHISLNGFKSLDFCCIRYYQL